MPARQRSGREEKAFSGSRRGNAWRDELVQKRAQVLEASESPLGWLRRYDMCSGLPEALYLQRRALQGLGRDERARDQFLSARDTAETIDSRRMLWRVLSSLSELENEPAAARHFRRLARQVIETIASHIDQDNLRRLFLSQPDLAAVVRDDRSTSPQGFALLARRL